MLGTSSSPISPLRAWLFVFVMVLALVATPLTVLSQTEVPAAEPAAEVVADETAAEEPPPVEAPPPAEQPAAEAVPEEQQVQEAQQASEPIPTGSLEIRLTSANGAGLSGHFAVTDAAGNYHERWTESGIAWFSDLVAGTATISQLSGTTDFWFDSADPDYIDIPAGGHATLPIINAFLDADGDGFGDSVDICGAGNDAVDTDADGTPDACDETPNGDTDGDGIDELDDPTPNGDDDGDGVDNSVDACPTGDDAVDTDADGVADTCDETPAGEPTPEPATSEVTAKVAAEPVVVESATVSCDQLAGLTPTIATDLATYAPGAVVSLTGAGWAPGQVVTIAVADEPGLAADLTAGDTGSFSHGITLPEGTTATYRVVATGQCSETPVEMAEIVAEVAAEPEVVASAPVTCQQADAVAPFIATDLADYPPGALVTLTGGNWVAGQTIEVLVEDDGLAEAEYGPWSHAATVTADAQGAFTYQFTLAPYYVADYTVVATGECSKAETSFTDSIAVTSATVNGSSSTTVGPGASISASVTVQRTAANDVTWLSTRWQIASGGTGCVDTPDFTSTGTSTATFPITAPGSGGEYDITFTAYSGANCSTSFASRQLLKGVVVSTDRSGTATINPTTATAGDVSTQFAITIRNTTSGDSIASARIAIPSGFTNVQVVTVTTSDNRVWSASTTTVPFISLQASNNGNAPLANGESLTVTFTAAVPAASGSYLWGTQAWKNTDFTSSTFAINSQPVVTVTAAAAAPTAADLALNCTPTSVSADTGQARTVDCIYSAQSSLGTRTVTLTQVTVPAPSGWTITGPAGSTVAGTTLTISPNVTISSSPAQSYSFSYTLTPACAASTANQAVAITSQFTFNSGAATAGAGFTGQVARTDTSSLAIALQNPSSLGWSQPFSFTGNTVTGNFVYRLTASGCGGWNVQISASPFAYTGSSNGTPIPAANLQLTSAGAPTVVTGSGTGVTAQPASGPMSTSKKVLAATTGSGIGSYDQQLNFSLAIPANSRVGSYTSTITIASATGP